MSSASHYGEPLDNGWTHRFWKKARGFGVRRLMSASHGGSDNINAANRVSKENGAPAGTTSSEALRVSKLSIRNRSSNEDLSTQMSIRKGPALERFSAPPELIDLCVLVVEDDMLVSRAIGDFLQDIQCQVLGPYSDLEPALVAARISDFDLGILDIDLNGVASFSIAEVLTARRKPFILTSGYGVEAIPPDRAGWLMCSKPFGARDLADMMVKAMREKPELATR